MSENEQGRRCPICGGRMEPGTVTHAIASGGRVFLFEHVPALVCVQCGESALTGPVVSEIERIIRDAPVPTRIETTSVYDLASGRHEAPVGPLAAGEQPDRPSRAPSSTAARRRR